MALLKTNTGIGTTNPTSALHVIGDVLVTGVVTATTFNGQLNSGVSTITTLNSTNATITNINSSGITTLGIVTANQLFVSGVSTFVGVITNRSTIFGTQLSVSGVSTFHNNVRLGDNDILSLGESDDLQLVHDGSNSFIKDAGTGSLILNTNKLEVKNAANDETGLVFNQDGAVELFFDNSKRFETTGIGVSLTEASNGAATLTGPSTIIIDPAAIGDNSGAVRIKGDLYVDGTQFIVNSSTIELADLRVGIATTVGTNLLLDGGGIGIGSDSILKTFTYNFTSDALKSSEHLDLAAGKTYKINGTEVLSATQLTVPNIFATGVTTIGVASLSQLLVTGISTFTGLVDANGGATIDNIQIGISGDNEIDTSTGDLILDSAAGTVNITDQLVVTGISTFNSDVDIDQSLNIDNNLTVTGISTFVGIVTNQSTIFGKQLSVSGISTFAGLVDANGGAEIDNIRIGIAGDNEIDTSTGNLTIDSAGGTVTIDDQLTVTGSATFNVDVDIDRDLNVDRNVTVTGLSTFTGLIDANGGATIDNIRIGIADNNTIDTSTGGLTLNSNSGTVTVDDNLAISGSNTLSFNSGSLNINHSGGNANIFNGLGDLILGADGNGSIRLERVGVATLAKFTHAGSVELYFDGSKKLETLGAGVTITGTNFANQLSISGVSTLAANGGITTTGGDLFVGGDLYVADDLVFDEATVRNINVTGIGTIATVNGGVLNYTVGNIVTGVVTTISGTNLNYTGVGTIVTFNSTTGTITNLSGTNATYNTGSFTNANVVTGVVTELSGTNVTYTTGSFTNANVVTGVVTELSGTNATYNTGSFTNANVVTGVVTTISGTNLNYTGVGTIVTLNSTTGTITSLSGTNATYNTGSFTNANVVTGIITSLSGTNVTYTTGSFTNANVVTGIITSLSGTNATYTTGSFTNGNIVTGIITELSGTNATYTTINATTGNIVTGVVTSISGTNLNYTGVGTIARLNSTNATLTNINSTGITTLGIVTANQIFVSGVTTSTGGFVGNLTGIAASATQLVTPRTFEITGDIVASPISFDGTANVSLAATIQPNSVGLGTDTFGDYVQSISGTANQITVTNGSGEGSTPVISIPTNPVLPGNVTIANDLQVNNNLNVTGNITIGGTSAYIIADDFRVKDADIVLGFTTNTFGQDVSNDDTANHGGVAVASTVGTPLVELFIAGIETNPATYKKIMWFKAGAFAGLGTDAWLSNYAVGIGSTQFPTGTRLAAGSVQFTERDLAVVRDINASGIITASVGNITTLNSTNANVVTGIITNLSGTNATYTTGSFGTGNIITGIITNLSGTNATYTTGSFTTGNIVTGVVTSISGTNLNYTGVGTIATLNSTTGTITNLSGSNATYTTGSFTTGNIVTGVVTTLSGTNLTYTNGNLTTLNATTGNIVTGIVTNLSGSNATYTTGSFTNANVVTGVVTNISGTNLNYENGNFIALNSTLGNIVTGVVTTISGSNLTYTTGNLTNGNIVTGVVTTISGTNLNYTGVGTIATLNSTTGTITNLSGTNATYNTGSFTNANVVTGVVTNLSGTNATYTTGSFNNANVVTGIITELSGTNATYNTGSFGTGNIVTGVVTTISGTNLNYTGVGTVTTLNSTNATLSNINSPGISTLGSVSANQLFVSGVSTFVGVVTNQSTIFGTQLSVSGLSTLASLHAPRLTYNGVDFGNFSGFVPVANGAGGWSWQSVTSTFSVNNILNGFNVFEEGAVVGTAGSITTLDFRGNNIFAFADPQPNGIATIRLSDTPTFDSLVVTGITTLGVTTSSSLSANQLSVSGVSTFIGVGTFIGDLFVGGDLFVSDDLVFDSFTAREISVTEKSSLGFASATTLNVTGISTFTNVNASNINVTGIVTASAFNGNVNAGVGTITTLNSTTGNITTLNSTTGNIVTGVVTTISGTNLNYTGVGTIATLSSTNATITTLSNTNINSSGVITATQFSTGVTGSAINITSNEITGPSLITIDPAGVGDNSGAVRIKGDFYVDGTQTIINSQTIDLADFRIGIGTTATSDIVLDGAGIGIGSASNQKTFTWNNSSSSLKSSENLDLASGKTYKINGVDVLSSTTLGSSVVNSSLTSVGTLGQLQVTGISTFTDGPVLVGSATSSGTLDQKLQITGGTYISGSTGIGTTNPGYKLHVIGDVNFTGSLYQNGSQFAAGVGIGSTSVNPQSGVINQRIGVGFTDLNIVGTGISVTGYGSTVVIDFGNIAAASGGALSISTVFAPRIQDISFVGGATTSIIGISTQTDRFVYDTQTGSIGIGTSGSSIPAYKLDVIGDINSSTSVKIKGVDVLEEAVRLAIALG